MSARNTLIFSALVVSGASSLVLETVWARHLHIVFGSGTLAVSTILVTYMLGLAFGARAGGYLASRTMNPLLLYGTVEFMIGLTGLLSPFVVQLFAAYMQPAVASLDFGWASLMRFGACQLFFLIPTLLMGATLPLAVQAMASTPTENANEVVGTLYGANTIGALLGVTAATVLLLPRFGQVGAIYVASLGSILIGAALALTSKRLSGNVPCNAYIAPTMQRKNSSNNRDQVVIAACFLTGAVALTMEVVWTRLFAMIIGSSVYSFATVLAVFLAGIAGGSLLATKLQFRHQFFGYGCALILAAVLILLGSYAISSAPSVLVRSYEHFGISPSSLFGAGIAMTAIVIVPATLIFGWLIPTACRALAGGASTPGGLVAAVYFWNTIGSALGAFVSAYILIRMIGTETTVAICAVLLAALGVIVLRYDKRPSAQRIMAGATLSLCVLALAFGIRLDRAALTAGIFYHPQAFLDYGLDFRPFNDEDLNEKILFYEEGLNSTVSIHKTGTDISLRVNGKTDASTGDMPTQILLGALPMLFGGPSSSVLVIGLGSGVTPGSALQYQPEKVRVVELESAVVRASRYFDAVSNKPLDDPRVTVIEDDGRLFLASTEEKFDVIISEPSNPWISGASSLFTQEFFAQAKSRLRTGGRLAQWVQLYGMTEEMLLSLIAAMHDSFPYVYGFRVEPHDSDLMLIGATSPLTRSDLPVWLEIPVAARNDLQRLGVGSTADLWSLMELSPRDVSELVRQGTKQNSDDSLYIELKGPLYAYAAIDPVFDLLVANGHSWLNTDVDMTANELAEIALSQIWFRADLAMAEIFARASLDIAVTGSGQIATAVWAQFVRPEIGDLTETLVSDVIQAEPANGPARFTHARLLFDRGDYRGALEDIQKSIDSGTNLPDSYRLQLAALSELENWHEAEAVADKLLHLPFFQLDNEILLDVAIIKNQLGKRNEAIEHIRGYLNGSPNNDAAWQILSEWLDEAGDHASAQAAFENHEITRQNSAVAIHRSVRSLSMAGNSSGALELAKLLSEQYPDYGEQDDPPPEVVPGSL